MSITNGYATREQVKDALGLKPTDTGSDARIDRAIGAASRQIDGASGRRYWQDAAVEDREFYADDPVLCYVDDISTTTGLVVKVDSGCDGSFATTLPIGSHFLLLPRNAAARTPEWPYDAIQLTPEALAYFPMQVRPAVKVTAKFGWPAVPDDITAACIIQATQLYKAPDAVFGGLSFGDGTFLRVRSALNPMAESLIEPYCKPRIS